MVVKHSVEYAGEHRTMGLKVFNTLGGRKEEFVPMNEGKVRMYVCGPTVYDFTHIGNARAFIVGDIVSRYLEYK